VNQKLTAVFRRRLVYSAPIGGFTYLIWALVRSKGLGPIMNQPPKLQGRSAVFPLIAAMVSQSYCVESPSKRRSRRLTIRRCSLQMSCMSNMATVITNNPDITANAMRPRDAMLPQLSQSVS
jgi:NCS1 family nucleobase:cation symporter-1